MVNFRNKTDLLAYFLHYFNFCLSEAAILGGRPKSVSEEDVSALFFMNNKSGLPFS